MNLKLFLRIMSPPILVSILLYLKFRCYVSPKSEVEMDNIKVGKGTRISSFCKLKSRRGPLVIGSNVDVAVGCFLSSSEKNLVIGNDVSIGPNCSILSNSYNFGDVNTLIREQGRETKGTVIGNNIFIGSGSVILDGSDIGDGCVISANSVVSGRIPRNSIVAGNPAKIIFTRR